MAKISENKFIVIRGAREQIFCTQVALSGLGNLNNQADIHILL